MCSYFVQDAKEVAGMKRFVRLLIGLIVLVGLVLPFSAAAQGPLTYGSSFQIQNLEAETAAITITFSGESGSHAGSDSRLRK